MHEQLSPLIDEFGRLRVDSAIEHVGSLPIEVPSWGFGRGGTRFEVYKGGEPSTPLARIESAGKFHSLTGKGATVALHFPWDGTGKAEIRALGSAIIKAGLKPGSVNLNLFSMREKGPLDAALRFGSLTHPDPRVRKASIHHGFECIDYARILGSGTIVLWLPDGTNSPGQMSLYDQADRLENSVKEIYSYLNKNEKLLIEYKLFEPGFYSTAIQDYGRSLYLSWILGDRAKVLVDLGHHPKQVNVEQIVCAFHFVRASWADLHFNDSFYANDDLASGSLNPHQLFRILVNLVEGELRGYSPINDLALMIDQSHDVKIRSKK